MKHTPLEPCVAERQVREAFLALVPAGSYTLAALNSTGSGRPTSPHPRDEFMRVCRPGNRCNPLSSTGSCRLLGLSRRTLGGRCYRHIGLSRISSVPMDSSR